MCTCEWNKEQEQDMGCFQKGEENTITSKEAFFSSSIQHSFINFGNLKPNHLWEIIIFEPWASEMYKHDVWIIIIIMVAIKSYSILKRFPVFFRLSLMFQYSSRSSCFCSESQNQTYQIFVSAVIPCGTLLNRKPCSSHIHIGT